MAKMGCAKCGGTKYSKGGTTPKKKMQKGGMPTKVLGPAKQPFAAGIPYFTGAGQTGPESMQKGGAKKSVTPVKKRLIDSKVPMRGPDASTPKPMMAQKGGSFAPNRAVSAGCRGGMVKDENGRCVMQRKMAEGGSALPDFSKDGKITQKDVLMGRGVIPKAKKGGNWIQGAIKRPGAFSAKAKAAGMSTSAFAAKVTKPGSKASTLTKRQANLAKTLGKMRKK